MVSEGFEEVDWLEIDEIPDTDRLEEKMDDMGVAKRLGEDEVELSWADALANSSSVGMMVVGISDLAAPADKSCARRTVRGCGLIHRYSAKKVISL